MLLAVTLVGVGVYLYKSTTGITADSVRMMDSSEAMVFNAELKRYMDKNIKGTEVIEFLRLIIKNNKEGNTVYVNVYDRHI